MTLRFVLAAGLALIAIGYLLIQFGALVLDDISADRATGEDAAYDAETAVWLHGLRHTDSEFDEWCEQAFAITRENRDQVEPTNVVLLEALMPARRMPAQRSPGGAS